MFNLTVEPVSLDKISARVDAMQEDITTFGSDDMPQGLTEWQTGDMHRKYPKTESVPGTFIGEVSVLTEIFPRSQTYDATHHISRTGRPTRRRVRPLGSMPRLIAQHLTYRSILRPELFDKLVERMTKLLNEKIRWR